MVEPVRLTVHTMDAQEAIRDLRDADLPAAIWRRVALELLRRLNLISPAVGQLSAAEVFRLAFSQGSPLEFHREQQELRLQTMEGREISRGKIKRGPLPEPWDLYLRYRQIRDLLQEGLDSRAMRAALQERWKRLGASGTLPAAVWRKAQLIPPLLDAMQCSSDEPVRLRGRKQTQKAVEKMKRAAGAAALLFVSKVYGAAGPDIIASIFRQQRFPLHVKPHSMGEGLWPARPVAPAKPQPKTSS